MPKRQKEKVLSIVGLALLLFACVILSFFNFRIWRAREENRRYLASAEETLSALQGEVTVENEFDEMRIEQMAREQLLLRKEGESVVVISRIEEDEEETEERKEKTGRGSKS